MAVSDRAPSPCRWRLQLRRRYGAWPLECVRQLRGAGRGVSLGLLAGKVRAECSPAVALPARPAEWGGHRSGSAADHSGGRVGSYSSSAASLGSLPRITQILYAGRAHTADDEIGTVPGARASRMRSDRSQDESSGRRPYCEMIICDVLDMVSV